MAAVRNNMLLMGYIFRFAPEMFVWKVFSILMILASDIAFNIIFLKYVIDAMSSYQGFSVVLLYIGGLAVVRVFCDFANTCYLQYIEPVARLKIHRGIYSIIYEKVARVDLEKFDDTAFYNDYIWALNQVDDKTKNTFNIVTQFIQNLLNVGVFAVLSFIYDKVLIVFIIIPVLINIFLGNYKGRLNYHLVDELTPVNRQRDYSRRGFYLRQYAKEIRTYDVGKILLRNFHQCMEEDIKITKKYRTKLFAASYCVNHAGWLFSKVLSAVYMSYQVLVAKAYTVGVFIVIYQAIGTFTNSLLSLFSVIPRFKENGLFAGKILKILNYESRIENDDCGEEMPDQFHELTIKDLSFQYPHGREQILKKINLTLHKGEKIALVGLNGAGKSTLIKLVLRLYDPTEGEVLVNGKNIREYKIRSYRDKFSTIFQDFQLYAIKLIENILMRETGEEDEKKAVKCIRSSNLQGYDDQLWSNVTKEFDREGIVFSGGQSQKVAIARAFAKDGDIMIMDEASSSLDPIAEAEINQVIADNLQDKSLIVISHRLSSIQYMDKIYFMEKGEIVEEGTHEELMRLNGRYAQMYQVQAEKYRVMEREEPVA